MSATPPHTTHVLVNASSENCTNDASNKMTTAPYCALTDALWYCVTRCNNTEMRIAFGTYILNSTRQLVFRSLVKFSMVGECSGEECSTIKCVNGTGLRFINSDSIAIKYLKFQNCGTRYNYLGKQAIAAVVFHNCTSLQLREISFIRSTGTALTLINPSDTVNIIRCEFLDSASNNTKHGGGVLIHFSCDQRSKVVLCNCHLANNTAVVGGGLYVNFTGRSSQKSLYLKNCHIAGNQATNGGGMFVKFHGNITNNSMVVENSSFNDNTCSMQPPPRQCYGGAVDLEIFNARSFGKPAHNLIRFKRNCTFTHNEADSGAGVSITTARHELSKTSVTFSDCAFYGNEGKVGLAIYVHAPYSHVTGKFVNISIAHCKFISNRIKGHVGKGAVYIADVLVRLSGELYFHQNLGTALTAVDAHVHTGHNAMLIFTENKCFVGGAIALFNGATLILHNNVHVEFTNNHAELKGGAIYVSDLYWDSLICPIHHVLGHTDFKAWNVTVFLSNNTVGTDKRSNSVYMPSILTCEGKDSNTSQQQPYAFCWENWYYENNCSNEVQTAPRMINFTNELSVFPGQSVQLFRYLQLYDDYDHDVTNYSVVTVTTDTLSTPLAIANGRITFTRNAMRNLTITTSEPRVIQNSSLVKILSCPPGYAYNYNSHICECARDKYGGHEVIFCNSSHYEFTAALYWTRCMTLYNGTDSPVVSGICFPYVLKGNASKGFLTLPHSIDNLDNFFCKPMKRTGRLCSWCMKGFGFPVLSYNVSCIKCNSSDLHWNLLKYISAQYIPLTLFLILVIVFKVSVNNGYANAFIFYAQMLTNQFVVIRVRHILDQQSSVNSWIYSILMFPYTIWNLDFIQPIPPIQPFGCISPALTNLHILTLNYIVALYPLALLAISFVLIYLYEKDYKICTLVWRPIGRCFARFHQKWNTHNTIVDSFGTFIVLSYSKVCWISFQLLAFSFLSSNDPNIEHNNSRVLLVDASISYWAPAHIPFFIIAVVFLSTYITLPPLLLLLYPLKVFQRCLDKLRLRGGLVEALFVSFTACYKDGTNGGKDCRYFAAIYFILRILALFLVCGIPPDELLLQGSLETISIIGTLVLVLTVRPYHKTFINYADAFIFTCLALLVLIGSCVIDWYDRYVFGKKVFLIISSLPFLYMVIFLIYKAYTKCPCRLPQLPWKKKKSSIPCSHRLLYPGEYEDLS